MNDRRLVLSFAAAISVVMISAFVEINVLLSLALAVLVHELGHVAAIYAMGLKLEHIAVEPSGFRIKYSGIGSEYADLISSAAGPTAGLLYFGVINEFCPYLRLSGELSLFYSLFNLMPVYPLDGGRIINIVAEQKLGPVRGEEVCRMLSGFFCVLFTLSAALLFLIGQGGAMLAAGIWLCLVQNGN